jgi:trans-aconitate methyltransferase
MAMIAQQFGRPRGLLGRLIGRGMAKRNGEFSRWVVDQLRTSVPEESRIVELGPGPGVGLEEIVKRFPQARVWGIDPSAEMLSQSRKRNSATVATGRLSLIQGNAASLSEIAPVDVIVANHVLYFWHEPADELAQIHSFLLPGGLLALGYQLKQNMPSMAQKNFPRLGHLLYESEAEVDSLFRAAKFTSVSHLIKGEAAAPEGRLALGTA